MADEDFNELIDDDEDDGDEMVDLGSPPAELIRRGQIVQPSPIPVRATAVAVDHQGNRVFPQKLADAELAGKLDAAAESGRYLVILFYLTDSGIPGGSMSLQMFRKLRDFPPGDFLEAISMGLRDMVLAGNMHEGMPRQSLLDALNQLQEKIAALCNGMQHGDDVAELVKTLWDVRDDG